MSGIAKQVIGSFEDIGEKLVQDTATVPTEVMGKALESLGAGSSNQQGQKTSQQTSLPTEGPVAELDKTKEQQAKKTIARSALEQLLGGMQKRAPSEFEQKKAEEQQVADMKKLNAEKAKMSELPKMSAKRKRGDLHGIKAKSSTELSKNVRQD